MIRIAPLALAAAMLVAGAAHASRRTCILLQKYGCSMSCRRREDYGSRIPRRGIKYRGNPRAPAILVAVVRKGVHGGGPWPMPPSPQVTDSDAARIVQYILALRS
jgi:cytochrome c551/c552